MSLSDPGFWVVLVVLLGAPIGIIYLIRNPHVLGLGPARFPDPPGGWTPVGENVPLREVEELGGDPDASRRRNISNPRVAEIKAKKLWMRDCNSLLVYFFYGAANSFLTTPFRVLPICVITGLRETEIDLLISGWYVFRHTKQRNSNNPNAKRLGKEVGSMVRVAPDAPFAYYERFTPQIREIMKRFYHVERFGDTLILAGGHSLMLLAGHDFFADAQQLIDTLADRDEGEAPIDLFI